MKRVKNTHIGIFRRVMIISITLLFLLHFNIERTAAPTGASPTISFVDPTDPDNAYVNRTYTYVNVSVSDVESPNDLTAFINWNDTLVCWWRFNENTGTSLTDFSGNGNDGTLNNFDWTAESNWTNGKFGPALRFDGDDDYVEFGSISSPWTRGSDDYTLEAWIKSSGFSSGWNTMLGSTWDSYNTFGIKSSGTELSYYTYDGVDAWYKDKPYSFSTDTWYHVAMVYDQTNDLATWYVDGNSIGTESNLIQPARAVFRIGATSTWPAVPENIFNGTIDEVRIHNRPLGPEEIKASYNTGLYRLYHNFTNLSEATYHYTAYVQDLDGNVNQTETRTVTIDTMPLIMNIISPLNDTTWVSGEVDLIVSFNTNVLETWYSIDNGANVTAGYNTSNFQTTLSLGEGEHNVTVYAKNGFGQLNSTTRYFTVNKSCVSGHTYGEWIITGTMNCNNTELIRHGVTTIQSGGALNLNNAIMQTYGNITVNAGGKFNLNNSTLKMVSIDSIEVYHADIWGDSNIENSTVISWNPNTNTTAPKSDGYKSYIKFIWTNNIHITNSNLSNLGGSWPGYPNTPGIYFYNVNNPVVQNNAFSNNYIAIKLENVDGAVFVNNTVVDGERPVWVYSSTNNYIIDNNVIGGDIGIFVMYSENIMIEGNTVSNITIYDDAYAVGILVYRTDIVTIENNNLTDIGYVGIFVTDSTKLTIENNSIDMMELSEKYSNTKAVDWSGPVIGIGILEVMGTWAQGAMGTYPNTDDSNRAHMTEAKSIDVTIANNTFGPNVQVLLYTQGTENLTHDLNSKDYWLLSYFFPRITDRDDLYISNNWSELSYVARGLVNRTTQAWWGPRVITNLHQNIFSHGIPYGRTVFFNYIVKKGNITILPQGYTLYNDFPSGPTDFPHDFYLYSPAYTPFGLNKLSTIYANGTTHILLYNDLTEPDGYHTMNMTVTPSSDSVNVTVLNFNTSYKKWDLSSDNVSVTVNHTIGDFTPFTEILIKKNGDDWNTFVSDIEGYISFIYDEGFSTVTFEAQAGSDLPQGNYTILKPGWNLISVPMLQTKQDMTSVLDSIDGWYDAVQWYDASDTVDNWKHYKTGKPFGNDLFDLNETMGFWVHITNPGGIIFEYNGTQPTVNQTITLYPGWNLVGYPSLTDYNRSEGLNNLVFGTHLNVIWTYNVATQKWNEFGPSDYFEIGKGYWVHAKTTCVWEVPL